MDFCWCAVDFVSQNDICENRPFLREEFAFLLVVYKRSDNVRRKEVGGELNPVEFCLHSRRHRFYGQSLCQSRNALKEYVPVGKNAGEKSFDQIFLADYDFGYFLSQENCPFGRRPYFFINYAKICAHKLNLIS